MYSNKTKKKIMLEIRRLRTHVQSHSFQRLCGKENRSTSNKQRILFNYFVDQIQRILSLTHLAKPLDISRLHHPTSLTLHRVPVDGEISVVNLNLNSNLNPHLAMPTLPLTPALTDLRQNQKKVPGPVVAAD